MAERIASNNPEELQTDKFAQERANQRELLNQILMEEKGDNTFVPDDERYLKLTEALATLTPQERDVLLSRHELGEDGQKQTFAKIGEKYGVGRTRISHIEAKARNKLRLALSK